MPPSSIPSTVLEPAYGQIKGKGLESDMRRAMQIIWMEGAGVGTDLC